jgi:protein-arginine kinase
VNKNLLNFIDRPLSFDTFSDNYFTHGSRVSLVRNIEGHKFLEVATFKEKIAILSELKEVVHIVFQGLSPKGEFLSLSSLSVVELQYLKSLGLISDVNIVNSSTIFIDPENKLFITINDVEHLRICSWGPGNEFISLLGKLGKYDAELNKKLNYSFSNELGFYTSSLNSLGTGLKTAVNIFLPGLTILEQISNIKNAALKLHVSLENIGESLDSRNNMLYQFTNLTTIGKTELEILEHLEFTYTNLKEQELNARNYLMKNRRVFMHDLIAKSYSQLKYAFSLEYDEALVFLQSAILGKYYGIINTLTDEVLLTLLEQIKPTYLALFKEYEGLDEDINEIRANIIKKQLGAL